MSDDLPDIKEFDRFRLLSKIGEGGMGTVYLAEDKDLGRRVAIKFLSVEFGGDAEKINRFIQEAKAASALNHPNILTIFEIGRHENTRYIVSEYIEGSTLRELRREKRQTLDQKLGIALQIASALSAAHEAGIIHRDIKPENIMIRRDGLIKVLDFGLAKLTSDQPDADEPVASQLSTRRQIDTAPGLLLGTVAYMSPEQARGKKLDARSDIFSLGVVLFELFTERRPFEGDSQADLISAILKDDVPTVRHFSPSLPRELDRIIAKTLRKDLEHRYQTVKDLCIDLEDLREEVKYDARSSQAGEPTVVASAAAAPTNELTRSKFTTAFTSVPRFTMLHFVLLGFVSTALITGAFVYFRSWRGNETPPGGYKTSEVASWSSTTGELNNNASFSPDGKLIAFSSTRSGSKNIWVTQTVSTDAIQITDDANSNVDPIFSADGREVAYIAESPSSASAKAEIRRVPALGGVSRPIGQTIDRSAQLRRWMPNGNIYFQNGANLFVMDAATGASRQLTSFEDPASQIVWIGISNDEKSIAHLRLQGGAWAMHIGDASGANAKVAAEGVGDTKNIIWLSELKRIFFTSKVDGVYQAFVQDIGSSSRRLTVSETDVTVASAASDGSTILLTTTREQSNIWMANAKDGKETLIASDLNAKFWPAVSPDNQTVAYISAKSLSGANLLNHPVVSRRLNGNEGERITTIAQDAFLPEYLPNGTGIVFLRKKESAAEMYLANSAGGAERRIADGVQLVSYTTSPYNVGQATAFSVSPDGSSVVYPSGKSGAGNLWLTKPADSSEQQLTNNTDTKTNFVSPVFSPEGNQLAFIASRRSEGEPSTTVRSIRIIDVRTLQISDILETPKALRLLGWSADAKSLYWAEVPQLDGMLTTVTLRTGAIGGGVRDVASWGNGYFFNVSLSADRRTVAFAAHNDNRDDLWVIAVSGGTPRKLTANSDATNYYSRMAWLHDGSAIVYGKQVRFTLLSRVTDIK